MYYNYYCSFLIFNNPSCLSIKYLSIILLSFIARLPAEALSSEAFLSSEVPPTAQTTIIVDSNNFPSTTPVSSTTQTPKPSAGSKTSPPSSTSKITQASSKTTLPSKYSVDSGKTKFCYACFKMFSNLRVGISMTFQLIRNYCMKYNI